MRLLIVVAYLSLRNAFPGNDALQVGVCVLLVSFPQDAYYSLTGDVLSPLLFTLGMWLLLRSRGTTGGEGAYLLAGGVVAATVLVKLTRYRAVGRGRAVQSRADQIGHWDQPRA